jgi:hypothetical protein
MSAADPSEVRQAHQQRATLQNREATHNPLVAETVQLDLLHRDPDQSLAMTTGM